MKMQIHVRILIEILLSLYFWCHAMKELFYVVVLALEVKTRVHPHRPPVLHTWHGTTWLNRCNFMLALARPAHVHVVIVEWVMVSHPSKHWYQNYM